MSRFYEEVTLSARGMCLAAAAKRTQEDLSQLSVAGVVELEMLEADSLAVLRMHLYEALPDPALLLVARAGRTQWEVLACGEVVLDCFGAECRGDWSGGDGGGGGAGVGRGRAVDGAPRGYHAGGGRGAGDEGHRRQGRSERRLRGVADGGGAALGGVYRGRGRLSNLRRGGAGRRAGTGSPRCTCGRHPTESTTRAASPMTGKGGPGTEQATWLMGRDGQVHHGRRAGAAAGYRRGHPDRLQERRPARAHGAERESEGAGGAPVLLSAHDGGRGGAHRGAPPPA